MKTEEKILITVETNIDAPVEKVWNSWTSPNHIIRWNFASDDWFCPWAKNDIREGGKFSWRMEAKDGSFGFDFGGEYTTVKDKSLIEYTIADGRKVKITFVQKGNQTQVTEVFEAEQMNAPELQKNGWQTILDNFKKHVEMSGKFETLHFEIDIEANPEKVYQIMLNKKYWNNWTSVFNPSSYFEGAWGKGSEIRFIGTDNNGKTGGMVGKIEENIPNRFVSIFYKGIIKDGIEITQGPEIEEWYGAHENYTYESQDGNTLLKVNFDSNREFKDYFTQTYPKALKQLKTICEQ